MAKHPQPDPAAGRRQVLRFVLGFAGSLLLFQLLFLFAIVGSAPFEQYLELCASTAGRMLTGLGVAVAVQGTELSLDGAIFKVSPACSGLQPLAMLSIAILAFPSSWPAKLPGLLVAVLGLGLLNLVRIVSLCVIGARWADSFELFHLYLWPMALILCSIGLWTLWARRMVRP